MLKSALDMLEQQKELRGENALEFACVSQEKTITLAGTANTLTEKKKNFSTYLPKPLKEPEFRSFPGANIKKRKMTGEEAALAAEANKLRHKQKLKKALESKEKYKAELVAMEASQKSLLSLHESLLLLSNQSSSQQLRQVPNSLMNISASPSSTDSENDNLSVASPKIRKSGQVRKFTKKAESESRRNAIAEGNKEAKKLKFENLSSRNFFKCLIFWKMNMTSSCNTFVYHKRSIILAPTITGSTIEVVPVCS